MAAGRRQRGSAEVTRGPRPPSVIEGHGRGVRGSTGRFGGGSLRLRCVCVEPRREGLGYRRRAGPCGAASPQAPVLGIGGRGDGASPQVAPGLRALSAR